MVRDRAYLVIIRSGKPTRSYSDDGLQEMRELIESAGGIVVGAVFATIPHPSPSHFIRAGKLAEVREKAHALAANVVIVNVDLTPVQARNVEAFLELRAVDRTGLILDIFARRAITGEGKLQVELAQLNYLMPRLVGHGVLMSRTGGGIGTRGPGEQKLEVDRRKIRERIERLKRDLKKLRRHRALLRAGRQHKGLIQVAIVGYTNAGKSTLLNALTGGGAYVEDKLFATLDPRTRIQKIGGRRDMLFTDTVGFLNNLPHSLIEAFHATLEEVTEAEVLIHVVDASNSEAAEQRRVVDTVLSEIGVSKKPTLLTLNKIDLLSAEEQRRAALQFPGGILISAQKKLGLQTLVAHLESLCPESVIS